jgi:hypothetical protein
MSQTVVTQLLALVAGTVLGVVGTVSKGYYDRHAESRKNETAAWLDLLAPLRVTAEELRRQLKQACKQVHSEKDIPEDQLTYEDDDGQHPYYLRHWFWKCKEYVINPSKSWSDDERLQDFAMHSGGMGNEATSTLYITAWYLFYATQVRFRPPNIKSKEALRLRDHVDAVRRAYEAIGFYPVTQDSTGISMKGDGQTVKNFRQFGESITNRAERGWFLTLTDVYFQLHKRDPEQVNEILRSLDALVDFLKAS